MLTDWLSTLTFAVVCDRKGCSELNGLVDHLVLAWYSGAEIAKRVL